MFTQFPLDTKYKKVLTEKNKLETGKIVDNVLISGGGRFLVEVDLLPVPSCVCICVCFSVYSHYISKLALRHDCWTTLKS